MCLTYLLWNLFETLVHNFFPFFLQLVPAVTELIVSELLYMQYTDSSRPCYIYINSTGCQRADGEVVGFETEATSIYDTMKYIGNEVSPSSSVRVFFCEIKICFSYT